MGACERCGFEPVIRKIGLDELRQDYLHARGLEDDVWENNPLTKYLNLYGPVAFDRLTDCELVPRLDDWFFTQNKYYSGKPIDQILDYMRPELTKSNVFEVEENWE